MSRELKFRAWDIKEEKMWMVDAVYPLVGNADVFRFEVETSTGREKRVSNFDFHYQGEGSRLILMQYTDLKDKNKNEICDDDIYKDAKGIISRVRMAVDGWALFPVMGKTPVRNLYWQNVCVKTQGVIIGNAHQHPGLLENNNENSI